MPAVDVEALGQSEAFLLFQEQLSRVAPVERPVMIVGERGTGKELAAVRLHYLSLRWHSPLITLNCSALTPSLIETELFGHERGAFTGAQHARIGRFEAADGGTLFLDEIGNIPMEVQEKILRVVEYGTFERVGSSKATEVDVRIIGATHADLPELAHQGRFKQDLLDRLAFEVLTVPPLRERTGDILLLAHHFARGMAAELGLEEKPRFSPASREELERHDWPGNVRELKNVVERAVYRSDSSIVDRFIFNPFHAAPTSQAGHRSVAESSESEGGPSGLSRLPLKEAVSRLERYRLKQALTAARYNQRKAAGKLGLSYHQFRGLYRKYQKEISGAEERRQR
jgi:psp operon transcriptional activator